MHPSFGGFLLAVFLARVALAQAPVIEHTPVPTPLVSPAPVVAAPAPLEPTVAKPAAKPKLFVLEPVGERIEPAVIKILDDVVLTEVSKTGRFEVMGSSDVKRMLNQVSAIQACGGDSSEACLAEIGGALGAGFLLNTSIGKLGTQYVLSMKLIDIAHGQVTERRSEHLPADEDALSAAVIRMVASIFPTVETRGSVLPWVAFGAGAAGAIAYGAFAFAAYDAGAKGDFDRTSAASTAANAAGGVAITAVAFGVGLWFFTGDSK